MNHNQIREKLLSFSNPILPYIPNYMDDNFIVDTEQLCSNPDVKPHVDAANIWLEQNVIVSNTPIEGVCRVVGFNGLKYTIRNSEGIEWYLTMTGFAHDGAVFNLVP